MFCLRNMKKFFSINKAGNEHCQVQNATSENTGPDKETFERKIVIIFLHIKLNMCFGCSKEPSLD